jgi:adenylate cyclase
LREIVDNYQKGLYAYRGQDWDNAVNFFNAVLALDPDDGPSKTMLERCGELKADPPGEDWDGSYTMRTK